MASVQVLKVDTVGVEIVEGYPDKVPAGWARVNVMPDQTLFALRRDYRPGVYARSEVRWAKNRAGEITWCWDFEARIDHPTKGHLRIVAQGSASTVLECTRAADAVAGLNGFRGWFALVTSSARSWSTRTARGMR